MIGFYFFDNVHVNADGKITEPMSENKQKRDANGRFVKSTEPKKQETKKSPCGYTTEQELIKALEDQVRSYLKLKDDLNYHIIKEHEIDRNCSEVIKTQRSITLEIIARLNWFQRRRLRKILSHYPDNVYGYYMEKDV